ncbi:MAG: hypothetical protein KDB23_30840, partial [Planctomycetales bacterium]|nr:hypothetical protein [Planctomycetales bacterium]
MHWRWALVSTCFAGISYANIHAQETANAAAKSPVVFTTKEDHQQMMRQLGITKLRPGPSGNAEAPNHANYDESLANPFPDWP